MFSFYTVIILWSVKESKFPHYISTIHVSQFGGKKIKLIWIQCTCMILLTIIQSFFVFLFVSISKIFFISSWLVYTYTPLPSNYGSFWCFHITQTIWSKIIYYWSNISSHLLHDKYWCEKIYQRIEPVNYLNYTCRWCTGNNIDLFWLKIM